MIEQNGILCHVRESFSGLRMDVPVADFFAKGRLRRRNRLSALTAAAAATAGAATALTLTLGGPAPVRSGNPPPSSTGSARLVAFSVDDGPGDSTTLTLYKGPQYPRLDPSALRQALARHGIAALVTVGRFCRPTTGPKTGLSQVLHSSDVANGQAIVIDGSAMPPGSRLSVGYFPNYVRMALIDNGAGLSCSTSHQPAVHITPTGTPIRSRN